MKARSLVLLAAVEIGPVEETDCLWYLLSFIPITTGNNMQGIAALVEHARAGDGSSSLRDRP